jgi:hypothetical protein
MRVFRGSVGRTLLVIAVGLFLESVPAFSQNSFGSIVVTVTDITSQAPIMQTEGYWQSLWLLPPESSQKRLRSALGPSIEVSEPIFDSEVSHV